MSAELRNTPEMVVPPAWTVRANCLGETDLYDLLAGVYSSGPILREARAICAKCTVTAECLQYAMDAEVDQSLRYGVFGGLTAKQRGRIAGPRLPGRPSASALAIQEAREIERRARGLRVYTPEQKERRRLRRKQRREGTA